MKRALVLALVCAPALARAHDLTAEADLGATVFLGSAGDDAAPGPSFQARVGWGPRRWLTIAALAGASTHEATLAGPTSGQFFQLYLLGLDVRFTGRVGRVGLFLEGSGGVAFISSNVLDDAGITPAGRRYGSYLQGGGGLEYHIANPRYAFGLAGDIGVLPDLDLTRSVSVRVFLRYVR